MAKIYLPTDYVNNSCKVVYDNYIRVYDDNSNLIWTDVYFKNGYYLKSGSSNYSIDINCDSLNTYTDNIFYRYDISNSLIIFFIIAIVCFWFPYKIFVRSFGRWLRI